jgi:hypothetical protein
MSGLLKELATWIFVHLRCLSSGAGDSGQGILPGNAGAGIGMPNNPYVYR